MRVRSTKIASALVAVGLSNTLAAAEHDYDHFERSIRPALVQYCYECHSAEADKIKGGLRLDTRASVLAGGESGAALIPNDPESSLLIQALRYENDLEMPPSGRLPQTVVRAFEQWIQNGAPDPRDPTNEAKASRTASDRDREPLWSLKSLAPKPPRAIQNLNWSRQPMDPYILNKMEAQEIHPNQDADWPTFLRRLNFDLIGLPPTLGEISEFNHAVIRDPEAAIAAKVDQLLSSPQFGERWGRHWLDVARYADSNGQSRDVLFPHAWRYRNWVINAFNRDLPYDDFIQQQIAGDLLPAHSSADAEEKQIATGFLAIGSKPLVAGNLALDLIDDQIDAVTRSFLGLTASCARCHDHKFDPIPTADYYALGGIFASTKTLYGGGPKRPKSNIDAAKLWMTIGRDSAQALEILSRLEKEAKALSKQENKRTNELKRLQQAKKKNADRIREVKDTLKRIKKQKAPIEEQMNQLPLIFAMGVQEATKSTNLEIRIRGEKNNKGAAVPRGFLSCIELASAPKINPNQSGRLELAHWITDTNNPLTARVAANRVWAHLFGRGLVETVDNFGHSGATPSHPALLDYLASNLMANGWSIKSLIKEIVTSRTYRLASNYDAASHTKDPENLVYWRFNRRRLEVEPIHDTLLALGGALDRQPPLRSIVAQIGEGEVGRGINTQPLEAPFHHRAVYLPVLRTAMIGIHKTFDYPDPSSIQGNRESTNVPRQSLFMLNSPLVVNTARSIAGALLAEDLEDEARVRRAYLLCYSRPPEPQETTEALAFLHRDPAQGEALALWTTFTHAFLAAAEFRYLE